MRAAKPAWTKFDYDLTLVKNKRNFLSSPRIHSGSWRSELFTHCLVSLQRMELSWIFGQKKKNKNSIHKQGCNQAESLVKKFCSCPRSDERSPKDLERGCIIRLGFQSLTERAGELTDLRCSMQLPCRACISSVVPHCSTELAKDPISLIFMEISKRKQNSTRA